MFRNLRIALVLAVMSMSVLATGASAHGSAGFVLPDPSCSRSADLATVGIALDNPSLLADPAGVSYAAFYVQGYYDADPGWLLSNGQYWKGSYADGSYPSWLYDYGSGQWQDHLEALVTTASIADYYRVWVYAYWADGHQGWTAVSNWCLA